MDTTNKAIEDALGAILGSRQKQKGGGTSQKAEHDPRLKRPPQDPNDNNEDQGSDSNESEKEDNQGKKPKSSQSKGSSQSTKNTKKDKKPQIGDQGNKAIQDAEEAARQANAYKEDAQQKSDQAKQDGDDDLQGQADKLADKADDIKDKAEDLAKEMKNNGVGDEEKARLKKIQDELTDAKIRKDLLDETDRAVFTDRQLQADKKRRREYENAPARRFLDSLQMFIRDELAYQRTASWKHPSKKQSPGGIISKGKARSYNAEVPKINVYFDRSGSWDDSKIKVGQQAVASLRDLEKKGKIKIGIYYFSDHVHSTPEEAEREGGTSACQEILDHIKATKANNVIIMTDSDMDYSGAFTNPVRVSGAVWFLFKGGRCAEMVKYLHGAKMTKVYDL